MSSTIFCNVNHPLFCVLVSCGSRHWCFCKQCFPIPFKPEALETSPYLLLGAQDQRLGAEQDQLPKRRKRAWFGHVTRHYSLSKTILYGSLEGGRRHGRHRKCWMDNIKQWTSLPMPELLTRAYCKKKSGRGSLRNRPSCPPDDPIGQGTDLNWTDLTLKRNIKRIR